MRSPAISNKRRLIGMLVSIMILFVALIARLFFIQVIRSEELSKKALDQWTSDLQVSAKRGKILDVNNQVLAQSGTTYMIVIHPKRIKDKDKDRVATELANFFKMDKASVLEKVSDNSKGEIVLKRQVEREEKDALMALNLGNGVTTTLDVKRYYPMSNLLSQTLGFMRIDGVGQEGLERDYDKYLAGVNGRLVSDTDASGQMTPYGIEQYIPPTEGYNLVLTTDVVVQSFLEKALKEALSLNQAASAQGIIMNPKTSEIVAISTQPDFDINNPPRDNIEVLRQVMRNRVVTDAYEPGSTFKVVTLSAGLDAGAVTMESEFNCPGFRIIDGERIKCWSHNPHGHETLQKGVQNSCNPVFMDIAMALGKEKFYEYLYAFGLGSSTESGITGEARGIVTQEKYVRNVDLARIGFGQSIAVTPIQLANVVCAAINGGNLMQPYIVDSIVDNNNKVIMQNSPKVVRRVISEDTSEKMRELLEGVVKDGSGRNAQIPGYRIGGKTGTAQKYENGRIAQGKLVASFVGIAPMDDPQLVCLILVDEPKVGIVFGSTVAAPFVKNVLEDTLRYYGIQPQYTEEEKNMTPVEVPDVTGMTIAEAANQLTRSGLKAEYDIDGTVREQLPRPGAKVYGGSEVLLYTEEERSEVEETTESVKVPDVTGRTRIVANDMLKEAGLKIKIEPFDQHGVAVRQKPGAGEEVEQGSEVIVEFAPPKE